MSGSPKHDHTWRNWTGDQICHPASVVAPTTADEVATAIAHAAERDWNVRVAGAGHSFIDAVSTDGMLLSLDRMNRVLDVESSSGLVRVDAGITLNALNEALAEHGLALKNLGDIDLQSLAGATASGTHGTGARLRNLSAGVHSVELVTASGEKIEVNASEDQDAWRAARVSLGALGVVTAMTLLTVPAFTLHAVDEPRPLDEVLAGLDELADSNDHFEFYTFPHSSLALTRTNNRVDDAPRPRSRMSAWVGDILLVNHAFGLVCRTGRRWPSMIPKLNRLAARAAGSRERVDRSDRIFASPRRVRFTEIEYAIPRERAAEAVTAVRNVIEERGFDVPFPLEVRFLAPDDAFLSPAFGRQTCCLSAHMFEGMTWGPYFHAVEDIMVGFGGRPHWGKRHFQSASTLRPRYPAWDHFISIRDRLDPEGRFANDYLRRVLA